MCDVMRGDLEASDSLSIEFLNAGKVGYTTAMMWLRTFGLPLLIAVSCDLENTRGKSKIGLRTASDSKRTRKKVRQCF